MKKAKTFSWCTTAQFLPVSPVTSTWATGGRLKMGQLLGFLGKKT
jgi:hypothetical protein